MTAEQFADEYKALQEQKREIESKQKALREAYVNILPFKVGDCISIDNKISSCTQGLDNKNNSRPDVPP